MKNLLGSNLTRMIWIISSAVVLVGALLKIFHYPYGIWISFFGLVSGLTLYNVEISRLKKRIKNLEKEKENDKLKAIN